VTDWVQVRVAEERYVIDVAHALEVDARGEVTRVPGAPPAVLGVQNLRGRVLPVIDLALALGVPKAPRVHKEYLVVVQGQRDRAALVVDGVLAVGALAGTAEDVDQGIIRGRLVAGEEVYGVLDVGRLLDQIAEAAT
jgi:purine-binding chemotaxis protein CheW